MIARLTLVALLLCSLVGCERPPDTVPPRRTTETSRPRSPVEHKVVGTVKKIDLEGSEVVIRHEAIPGYMAAMTMPFAVKDRALIEDLQPGDEVEGTLRVTDDDSQLVDLFITRPATVPATIGVSKVLAPGEPVPDFAMTTQTGEALRLSDLRGKAVVLTFIYTRCPLPNFCPLMDRKFGELADQIKAIPAWRDRVRLLSVSFDPEHDTPETLARHAKLKGAAPPLWEFAVATTPELQKVAGPLGLVYGPTQGEIVHNLCVAVIAPDGTLARLTTGREAGALAAGDLLRTLKPLLVPSRP